MSDPGASSFCMTEWLEKVDSASALVVLPTAIALLTQAGEAMNPTAPLLPVAMTVAIPAVRSRAMIET